MNFTELVKKITFFLVVTDMFPIVLQRTFYKSGPKSVSIPKDLENLKRIITSMSQPKKISPVARLITNGCIPQEKKLPKWYAKRDIGQKIYFQLENYSFFCRHPARLGTFFPIPIRIYYIYLSRKHRGGADKRGIRDH